MTITSVSRLAKWIAPVTLAVALTFGASVPLLAQEIPPEQLALAREYVDLTDKADIYGTTLAETARHTSALLSAQNPDIVDKIDAAITKIYNDYKGKKDDLFNQFARVYATTFTMDELQQIVAFYKTPAGQKLAASAVDINKGVHAVMNVYTYNFGTEFVSKVRSELKAQGFNL